jgi:hypothetical protein
MKKIFDFSTRQKIFISTTVLTIVYLFFQRIDFIDLFNLGDFSIDFLKPIILGALGFICMYWISEFKITGERFITILCFPMVGILVFSLFVELIINSIFGQLGIISFIIFSGLFFALFTYILLLTANVLNMAHSMDIPLGQAGRAAYYILNMVIEYLLFLIIISNEILILLQITFLFLVSFFIVTSTLWTIRLRAGRRVLISSSISFLVAFAYFVLSMWPVDITYIAFVLLIILYITLGIALEIREHISRMVWFEYFLLLSFIFLLLMIISSWGINGSLI